MGRYMFKKLGLFPNILSNSRLNRRIHKIPSNCWDAIFRFLSFLAIKSSDTCYFAVDSFPFTYCQKNRIDKRKRFLDRKYIGFAASKFIWLLRIRDVRLKCILNQVQKVISMPYGRWSWIFQNIRFFMLVGHIYRINFKIRFLTSSLAFDFETRLHHSTYSG
ncbi:putative transposase [Waddlia chondrophila WSU 86-1044]|uniref:Putative transposase n=1 Tax=Waddlia chondrophila (strain ATCC VR-1470 / WSU 86-1044) TaxID=716544 RepID=D6YVQ7_WADCW|nr:putative transposase [Waddlia chondrophila WSU 86-1044]